jgi:predicted metalloendopeptidase
MKSCVAATAALIAASIALTAQSQMSRSGLDLPGLDRSIRAQDDLFRYTNGSWLKTATIPPDRVVYGTFVEMADKTEAAIHAILEDAATKPHIVGTPLQQMADLYSSYLDEARLEEIGTKPIEAELARIDAITTKTAFAAEAGHLGATFAGGMFGTMLSVDGNDPTRLIVQVSQGGTRMPSRDYYLDGSPFFVEARQRYDAFLRRQFELIGRADAADAARRVMAVETAIARIMLSPLESREALRLVQRTTLDEMSAAMRGFDWQAWARPLGFNRASSFVLLQPGFFRRWSDLVQATPVETWKDWLASRYVFMMTPYLSQAFVDARFEFFGRFVAGQPEIAPRWKGAVAMVNAFLGDAVGQIYVKAHLPSRSRTRAAGIVDNVKRAYQRAIQQAAWLSHDTRQEALAKLTTMTTRIGAPDRWRGYSGLFISAHDLVGNWRRATRYANADRVSRVRGVTDGGGWLVNAQSMSASYNPATNEMVLTAAMLQPPVFDPDVDDAVNYGALGATIGHEITHAFDERGRRYDASGDLRAWFTQEEDEEYERRSRGLIATFNGFRPVPDLNVNGEMTLPENVADLAGLSVAYRAYLLSLKGKPAPVIDGFTGPQRFFLSYARMWRMKVRENYLRQWLLSLQYAPEESRTNGAVQHLGAFHEAFGVTAGDRLFREPDDRVWVW